MKNRTLTLLFLSFCVPTIINGSGAPKKPSIKDFQEMVKKQYAGYIGAATALAVTSAVSPRFRSYLQRKVYFSLRKYPAGVALFGGIVGLDMYKKWKEYKKFSISSKPLLPPEQQ
jgi:hypothetical protein